MAENQQLLVVAGDPSGDERAAEVLRNLAILRPDIGFFGIGGENLQNLNFETLYSVDEVNVFGILEAFKNYFRLKKIFEHILDEYDRRNSIGALLVDFGGFNLRLAKQLKERPGKTIYYISPQVWATRQERAHVMADSVDQLCVLFGFEKKFYQKYGIDPVHVGHPLMDVFDNMPKFDMDEKTNKKKLVLMPGSRATEITRHGPIMKSVVHELRHDLNLQITIIAAQGKENLIQECFTIDDAEIISSEHKYETMAKADCLLMSSGTATLEAALLGVPAVVIYKTSWLTGVIGKRLIKVPYVAMPNILADKMVYPEFVQDRCTVELVLPAVKKTLKNEMYAADMRGKLKNITAELGAPGAAKRVAEVVAGTI
jgi:lipid-A-disaccharide synthase